MWCTVRFFGANGRACDVLESNISTSIQSLQGLDDAILSVHAFDRDKLKTVRTRDGPRKQRGYTSQMCVDVTCNPALADRIVIEAYKGRFVYGEQRNLHRGANHRKLKAQIIQDPRRAVLELMQKTVSLLPESIPTAWLVDVAKLVGVSFVEQLYDTPNQYLDHPGAVHVLQKCMDSPHYSMEATDATDATDATEKKWVVPPPMCAPPMAAPPLGVTQSFQALQAHGVPHIPGFAEVPGFAESTEVPESAAVLLNHLQATGTAALYLDTGDPVDTLLAFLAEHNIPITDRLGYTKGAFPTDVFYYVMRMVDGKAMWMAKTDVALGYSGDDFMRDPGLLRRLMPLNTSLVDAADFLCSDKAQEYVYLEDIHVRLCRNGTLRRFFSQGQVVLWKGDTPAWVVREVPLSDPQFAVHIQYSLALNRRMAKSASPQVFLVVERATKTILFCNREDFVSILGVPDRDFIEDTWLEPCYTVVQLGGGLRWIVTSVHHGSSKACISFRSIDRSTSEVPYDMCKQKSVDLASIERVLRAVHGEAMPRLVQFERDLHVFIAKNFATSLGCAASTNQREIWTLQGPGQDVWAERNLELVLGVCLKDLQADYANGIRASFLDKNESLRLAAQWEGIYQNVEDINWKTGRTIVVHAHHVSTKEAITFLVAMQLVRYKGSVAHLCHWLELAPRAQVAWTPQSIDKKHQQSVLLPKASLLRGATSHLPPFPAAASLNGGAITMSMVDEYLRQHVPFMCQVPIRFAMEPNLICIAATGHSKILGYEDEKVMGTCILETVSFQDQTRLAMMVRTWFNAHINGTAFPMLHMVPVQRVHGVTGRDVPIVASGVLVNRLPDGDPMIIVGERPASLEYFQEAATHAAYWYASDDLSWIIGADDRLLYVTPQVETVLGMSSEELLNVYETTLLDPGDKAKLKKAIEACRTTGQDQAVDGMLTRYAKLPGGKVEPVRVRSCVRPYQGDVVRLVETLVPELREPDSPPLIVATKTWEDLFGEASVYKNPDPITEALAIYHHESIHHLRRWEDLETFVYRHYPNTLGRRPWNHPDDVWFLEDFQGYLLHCSANVSEVLGATRDELREGRRNGKMNLIFESDASAENVLSEWESYFSVERVREKSFQTAFWIKMPLVHATTRELKTTNGVVQVVLFGAQYVLLGRFFNEGTTNSDYKLSSEVVTAIVNAIPCLKPPLPPILWTNDDGAGVESYIQQHLPIEMKSAPICFVFKDGECMYSRGQKEILGYDDATRFHRIVHTVLLDDQVALQELHKKWISGILGGVTTSSLLRGFAVKRIHKVTGALIQMLSSAALIQIKGDRGEEEREGADGEAPFCFIVTETPVTYDAPINHQRWDPID